MLDLMTLYTTQRKQYVCWSDQSTDWVGAQQESGSEMSPELNFVEEFRYLGHVVTADCYSDCVFDVCVTVVTVTVYYLTCV